MAFCTVLIDLKPLNTRDSAPLSVSSLVLIFLNISSMLLYFSFNIELSFALI